MGGFFSTQSQQNAAPDSNSQQPEPESKTIVEETSVPESKAAEDPAEKERVSEEIGIGNGHGDVEEEEEEKGECGFCLFMKGGGCKEQFIDWENCVDEAEEKDEDVVNKCFQATAALKKCMEENSDYYAPILKKEKEEEQKQRSSDGEFEKGEAFGGNN